MMLLPPAPGLCQTCAVDHPSDEPHDVQSLYYQVKFKMEHGREPTWEDALTHVSDEMHAAWVAELSVHGVEVTSRD